jgi:membrane dipeptidase
MKPVAYTHILPAAPKAIRATNPTEDQVYVEHGGFVGVTMFPPFLANGNNAAVDDYVAAIDT